MSIKIVTRRYIYTMPGAAPLPIGSVLTVDDAEGAYLIRAGLAQAAGAAKTDAPTEPRTPPPPAPAMTPPPAVLPSPFVGQG